MLKKSLFSPAQPWCAKTHPSPSSVLGSFKPFTHRSKPTGGKVAIRSHVIEESGSSEAWCVPPALHSLRPCWAAFLSILQECSPFVPHILTIEVLLYRNGFPTACENTNFRPTKQVPLQFGFPAGNLLVQHTSAHVRVSATLMSVAH